MRGASAGCASSARSARLRDTAGRGGETRDGGRSDGRRAGGTFVCGRTRPERVRMSRAEWMSCLRGVAEIPGAYKACPISRPLLPTPRISPRHVAPSTRPPILEGAPPSSPAAPTHAHPRRPRRVGSRQVVQRLVEQRLRHQRCLARGQNRDALRCLLPCLWQE